MRKSIHIRVNDSQEWIGGLYYKRNILFSLLQNSIINKKYKIILTTKKENLYYFEEFKDRIKILKVDESTFAGKILLYIYDVIYNVKYVFPAQKNSYRDAIHINSIDWIPDFQHHYFPHYFSKSEIDYRNIRYSKIYKDTNPLILSSLQSKSDFETFYGKRDNIYVLPFVSYLLPELNQLNEKKENLILDKYNLLKNDYVCISNQFWKHKNHLVVLKAIKILNDLYKHKIDFVLTGMPNDYRDPNYFKKILELLNDDSIKKNIKILGFLDRVEQLGVMKNAKLMIQPSLFEGWGTVLEDAKVLDKIILLSDIPIHHEQMNENCILFDPYDPNDLAEKIIKVFNLNHIENIDKGINDMYKNAKEYSEVFLKLLKDLE